MCRILATSERRSVLTLHFSPCIFFKKILYILFLFQIAPLVVDALEYDNKDLLLVMLEVLIHFVQAKNVTVAQSLQSILPRLINLTTYVKSMVSTDICKSLWHNWGRLARNVSKQGGKWRAECLNTKFHLLARLYAEYSVKPKKTIFYMIFRTNITNYKFYKIYFL